MAKIILDKIKCIGCGSCVSVCPDFFEIAEDGKANVKKETGEDECIKEAVEVCPVQCIKCLVEKSET